MPRRYQFKLVSYFLGIILTQNEHCIALGQNGFPRAMQSRSLGPALPGSLLLGSQKFPLGRWMGLQGKGPRISLLSRKYQTCSLKLELTHHDLQEISKGKAVLHLEFSQWLSLNTIAKTHYASLMLETLSLEDRVSRFPSAFKECLSETLILFHSNQNCLFL